MEISIPYLLAIFVLTNEDLILEVSIDQPEHGDAVAAFINVNCKIRGVHLASIMVSAVAVAYFVIILFWIMMYSCQPSAVDWADMGVPLPADASRVRSK